MYQKFRAALLITAALICLSTARAERIPIPDGVFYYSPAAAVHGSEAAWTNPAALGEFKTASGQFMADLHDGEFAKSWGTVASRSGFALATRNLYNPEGTDFREYALALGTGLGKLFSVGGSYRYFSKGPGIYNNRHFWNIGIIGRPAGAFRWAAVFSNLNRGRVDGERTETEQRYSLAYRPYGDRLTLAVDVLFSTKQQFENAEFVYHAEYTPRPGLYVDGFIDSHQNFQIGVRANLLQYFVGNKSGFDSDFDHHRTTFYSGVVSARQPSIVPEPGRRLSLGISGRPRENPTRYVLGQSPVPFPDLLLGIYRAAGDPSISEMVLELTRLSLGFAQAQEIRDAIRYFRQQGKTVVCHVSGPNNIGYYVACAANSIVIPPVSRLNLIGLRAELTYYAGTLDKLGIKADVVRIGKYKRGAETYTREAPSEESREMTNRILDDLYDQFVTGIAEGRNLRADSIRALIDRGPFTSLEAMQLGLVDGLSYRDRLAENGFLSNRAEISFRAYRSDTLINDGWPPLPELAVVYAEGEITDGTLPEMPFDDDPDVRSGPMDRAFREARSADRVRGVVFRINSPGGLALAGDDIYHDADRTADRRLFVVSMGNVAASGGYYIAMPAQWIFAQPATITGSIGIYGGKADLSGLYGKIGLGKELLVRGLHAGMLSTVRPFTEEERARYLHLLTAFYDHFIALVADNRQLPADSVDALSRGRVWTGREAADNGLIDQLGGLKDAIDYAAKSLGLSEYRVVAYPEKRALFQLPSVPLLGDLAGLLRGSGTAITGAGNAAIPLADGAIYARLPFDISIE